MYPLMRVNEPPSFPLALRTSATCSSLTSVRPAHLRTHSHTTLYIFLGELVIFLRSIHARYAAKRRLVTHLSGAFLCFSALTLAVTPPATALEVTKGETACMISPSAEDKQLEQDIKDTVVAYTTKWHMDHNNSNLERILNTPAFTEIVLNQAGYNKAFVWPVTISPSEAREKITNEAKSPFFLVPNPFEPNNQGPLLRQASAFYRLMPVTFDAIYAKGQQQFGDEEYRNALEECASGPIEETLGSSDTSSGLSSDPAPDKTDTETAEIAVGVSLGVVAVVTLLGSLLHNLNLPGLANYLHLAPEPAPAPAPAPVPAPVSAAPAPPKWTPNWSRNQQPTQVAQKVKKQAEKEKKRVSSFLRTTGPFHR